MSFRVATLWGIPVRLHVSLVLLAPYLAWRLPGWTALVVGVGWFASIVLHELGHCAVAIRKGGRVRQILLLPIGGAAQIERIPSRPWDEILMAAAGPAVSVIVFGVLFYGGPWIPLPEIEFLPKEYVHPLQLLGAINAVLAIFNLLPAFPMDGGRILRALLSLHFGRLRATRMAMWIARACAAAGAGYALANPWTRLPSRLLLLAISTFVYIAAGLEYRRVRREAEDAAWFAEGPRFPAGVPPPPPGWIPPSP